MQSFGWSPRSPALQLIAKRTNAEDSTEHISVGGFGSYTIVSIDDVAAASLACTGLGGRDGTTDGRQAIRSLASELDN